MDRSSDKSLKTCIIVHDCFPLFANFFIFFRRGFPQTRLRLAMSRADANWGSVSSARVLAGTLITSFQKYQSHHYTWCILERYGVWLKTVWKIQKLKHLFNNSPVDHKLLKITVWIYENLLFLNQIRPKWAAHEQHLFWDIMSSHGAVCLLGALPVSATSNVFTFR